MAFLNRKVLPTSTNRLIKQCTVLSNPGGVFSGAMSRQGTWVGEYVSEGQEDFRRLQSDAHRFLLEQGRATCQ